MIGGTAYGAVLNDRWERETLAAELGAVPYGRPPVAPVLYIKPRNTFAPSGGIVEIPADLPEVTVAATLAMLFAERPGIPVAAALAIELSEPHDSFYRPAVRQRCRDGFLRLGQFSAWDPSLASLEIVTQIGGAEAHRWNLERLVRGPLELAKDVNDYMTLAEGDILMVGLPGDAPAASVGATVELSAPGLSPVSVRLCPEQSA